MIEKQTNTLTKPTEEEIQRANISYIEDAELSAMARLISGGELDRAYSDIAQAKSLAEYERQRSEVGSRRRVAQAAAHALGLSRRRR